MISEENSNLPSFFQLKGQGIVEALDEFELGGNMEDEDVALEEDSEEMNMERIKREAFERIEVDLSQYLSGESIESPIDKEVKDFNMKDEYPFNPNTILQNPSMSSVLLKNTLNLNVNNNVVDTFHSTAQVSQVDMTVPSFTWTQISAPLDTIQPQVPMQPATSFINQISSNHSVSNIHPFPTPHPATKQFHHVPPPTGYHFPNTGSKMKKNDIDFVLKKVFEPMILVDPFAQDYYNIQYKIKKNDLARDQYLANGSNGNPPPLLHIPLPTWKEAKVRIKQQMEFAKSSYLEKNKKWEEKEKVLGHVVKSDISKPKEVLSVPTLNDLLTSENIDGESDSLQTPFATRLWTMRQAIQQGYDALYTVQELQHLLLYPADNSFSRDEIVQDIDRALSILAQSLGIRNKMGINKIIHGIDNSNITLDGGLVAALLQTSKGKRLLSRSFELLPPNYRWILIPAIVARILQVKPSDQLEEDKVVEEKLLKHVLDFIRYAHAYQQETFLGPNSSTEFTYYLLGNLRQCIKSVMVTFMDKVQLRQALLSSRSRAEIMHVVIQVGEKVSEYVDLVTKNEWIQIRETFMAMLDN